MQDRFGRKITKMRVSVTDRCNLSCKYCMPAAGVKWLPHEEVLSLEEIAEVVDVAAELGITRVRLTGGEPLMRRGLCRLIEMIKKINAIEDLSLTTNGVLLAQYAEPLVASGLDRINISLDTLDPDKFREITRGGEIAPVLAGIEAAIKAKLVPIKLNCVIKENSQEKDAQALRVFAEERGLKIRFIRLMALQEGIFSGVEGGEGGDCKICNRIRLLCDGAVRPCLFSDLEFNVRELGVRKALELAVQHKPEMGGSCLERWMYQIGG